MCDCQSKECNCSNGGGGFVFGLILGALIAAAIIILNSKDKDKIIKKVKTKFNSVFSEDEIKKKINVIIPKDIIPPEPKPVARKPIKLFKK